MTMTFNAPGVYVVEEAGGARPIQAVGTSTAGFVGVAPKADAFPDQVRAINNWTQFKNDFIGDATESTPLSHAVWGFFLNGGRRCFVVNVGAGQPIDGGGRTRTGLGLLEAIDEIAIVAAPGYADAASYEALLAHCEKLKDRVAILDTPLDVPDVLALTRAGTASTRRSRSAEEAAGETPETASPGMRPRDSDYAAFYFPWITVRDPLQPDLLLEVPPSGHLAGIWARTDATRGVHKAPANEPIRGALNLAYRVTREEQGELNVAGVNCIRLFAREGIRVWGARTLAGGGSEWRYLNVRRLFNMIEESIADSTNWIVFEPNDRTLWRNIRRDIGAFLTRLWRDGALMGRTANEAFFVKCDEETNSPEIIDAGQVVTLIGVAPVKPAEFIIFRIMQTSAGTEVEQMGAANG